MKIELDGNMLIDEETGQDICNIEDLKGDLLRMVITSLISDRDNLSDDILHLNYDIEQLKEEIEELQAVNNGEYFAY